MGDGKNITAFYHIAVNLWIAAVEYCVVLYLSTLSMIGIVKKNLQGLHLLHNWIFLLVAFLANTMLKQSIHENFFH